MSSPSPSARPRLKPRRGPKTAEEAATAQSTTAGSASSPSTSGTSTAETKQQPVERQLVLEPFGEGAVIWDPHECVRCRQQFRVVGSFQGVLPSRPADIPHSGPPLVLSPEEVNLLVNEINKAVLVDPPSVPQDNSGLREAYKKYVDESYAEQVKWADEEMKTALHRGSVNRCKAEVLFMELLTMRMKKREGKGPNTSGSDETQAMREERASRRKVFKDIVATMKDYLLSDKVDVFRDDQVLTTRGLATSLRLFIPNPPNRPSDIVLFPSCKKIMEYLEIIRQSRLTNPTKSDKDNSAKWAVAVTALLYECRKILLLHEHVSHEELRELEFVLADELITRDDAVNIAKLVPEDRKKMLSSGETRQLDKNRMLVQSFLGTPPWRVDGSQAVEERSSFAVPPSRQLRSAVFADLYRKGFTLTDGAKFGAGFLAYPGDPIRYHAEMVVTCVDEDPTEAPWKQKDLVAKCRLAASAKKTAVLAFVRQGESGKKVHYQKLFRTQ